MSIASNIYRLDSMVFIRHCVFTKYLKFRVNPEKIVNSIFHSDTGASIEEFRKISSGYELGCPLPPIFIDWTRWNSTDTLLSENIGNFSKIQKKSSIRYFTVTQGLLSMSSDRSRVDMSWDVPCLQYLSVGLDGIHPTLCFLKILEILLKFRKNRQFDISQ